MPCNSDYMEPTQAEVNSRNVARFILFVISKLSKYKGRIPEIKTDRFEIKAASHDSYGNRNLLSSMTADLCTLIRSMDRGQLDSIVYNGRNATSRELATWWDEHQAADRKREVAEKQESLKQEIRAKALAKLSPKERKVLGF